MLNVIWNILIWWSRKDLKDKAILVCCAIGCLAGICLFIFLSHVQIMDIEPYTEDDLQRLYYQKELADKGDYFNTKLHDFGYSVYYCSDYYVITYNNDQLEISEKIDINGDIIDKKILDSKENIFTVYIMNFCVSFLVGLIIFLIGKFIIYILNKLFIFYKYCRHNKS
jgi:hypothetical protein